MVQIKINIDGVEVLGCVTHYSRRSVAVEIFYPYRWLDTSGNYSHLIVSICERQGVLLPVYADKNGLTEDGFARSKAALEDLYEAGKKIEPCVEQLRLYHAALLKEELPESEDELRSINSNYRNMTARNMASLIAKRRAERIDSRLREYCSAVTSVSNASIIDCVIKNLIEKGYSILAPER